MIPKTKNGLDAFSCISAMQKYIRRGMEVEAMHVACEMCHTSKQFCTMVLNRLEIISHEDIGLADPQAVMFVSTCVEQIKRLCGPRRP